MRSLISGSWRKSRSARRFPAVFEYVGNLSFSIDAGITAGQQQRIRAIKERAKVVAERIVTDRTGLRIVWQDGFPFVFAPPAWKAWWGDRQPLAGWEAIHAFKDFERFLYMYGEVVGRKLEAGLQDGSQRIYKIRRDFPQAIEHNPAIRARAATVILRGRGEKTAATRQAALDRWMTTVSRVEDLRRSDPSLSIEAA
jgi:hypothetical protein